MDSYSSKFDNSFKELVIKILTDTASSEEISMLQQYLEDVEKKEYFLQMKNAWQVSSVISEASNFDRDKAWEKAEKVIAKDLSNPKTFKIGISGLVRIAAIFVIAFLTGGLAVYLGFRKSLIQSSVVQNSINEVVSPIGGKSKLVLPDGTVVWLNAGSTLKYAQDYNTTHRNVYLEGEAYFKVKTNPNKPFIVKTSEMSVRATGTAFNVKAYPDEGTITTTLVEGVVHIEGTDKNRKKFEISLKPKQKLTYVRKGFKQEEEDRIKNIIAENPRQEKVLMPVENVPVVVNNDVKTNLYTSWKDENWVIEREDLDVLSVMLERRYNVKFVYKTDSLRKYKISGTIRKETLEQILDFLKLTVPLEYEIKNGLVTLNIDKTRSENYLKVMN